MTSIFRIFLLRIFFLCFTISHSALAASTLLIQFSDTHSAYDRIPNFVRAVSAIAQDFQSKNPDGKVILLANGDIAGANLWTEFDGGSLTYQFLAALSTQYRIAFTVGNHEAFDFVGTHYEQGLPKNGLFLKQAEELVQTVQRQGHLQPSFRILAANAVPTDAARHLFASSMDFKINENETLRIVGLALPTLMNHSAYDVSSPLQIFRYIRPLLEEAQTQLWNASQEGITHVIFQCHESFGAVKKFAEELNSWKAKIPALEQIKVPFVGAGHDHRVVLDKVNQTYVVDAGDQFAFSAIVLSDKLDVQSIKHWSQKDQKKYEKFEKLSPVEMEMINTFNKETTRVLRATQHTVGATNGFRDNKHTLTLGRNSLGNALADSLTRWAQDTLKEYQNIPQYIDTVAFLNSSAYRKMSETAPGPLFIRDVKEMIPFQRSLRLVLLNGSDVELLFQSIRKHREILSKYSPQLPSYMQEIEKYRLLIRSQPIQSNEIYALVLDDFLGSNGYGLKEFDDVFARVLWELPKPPTTQAVIQNYLCDSLLRKI